MLPEKMEQVILMTEMMRSRRHLLRTLFPPFDVKGWFDSSSIFLICSISYFMYKLRLYLIFCALHFLKFT